MRFFATLAAIGLLSVPAVAHAHTVMNSPTPRDASDAHKSGPCGGVARVGKPTQYTPGQKVTVEFTETVDHRGCFQVAFSAANDANFTVLAQIDDPTGDAVPKKRTVDVTLPTTPCPACTLVVRQLMINQPCKTTQQPNETGAGDTYFSCADICIGATCTSAPDPDAGSTSSSSSSGSTSSSSSSGSSGVDSGVSTKPAPTGSSSSSSGTPSLDSGKGDDGCNTSGSSGTEAALAAVVGVAIVAGLRRRRRG